MPQKKTDSKKTAKPSKVDAADADKARKKKDSVRLLRGMRDVLPEEQQYRYAVFAAIEKAVTAYGYYRMDLPILEQANLFVRSLGKDTDVIDKEMYAFEDKSGDMVALRPEFTAGMARAYIEHGMLNRTQPVKLFTSGLLFRYDRPQAGRYRQFTQLDCEVMGGRAPIIDAELISLSYSILKDLGITSTVHINSIGSVEDRKTYVTELTAYFRSKRRKLSEDSKKRITKNPLRILDSKDEQDQAVVAEAPQIVDWLSEDSKNYFITVLEYLDDIGIPYKLESSLVRGLDYYNDIVFELHEEGDDKSQSALVGGGRYDGLVEMLGGQPTECCGFAMGIERVILSMKAKQQSLPGLYTPDVFLAQLGKSAQKFSLGLMEELRKAGFNVRANLIKGSLTAQLKDANKLGAKFALILGQKELLDGTIMLRDMESGSQEIVDIKKVQQELIKRMNKTEDDKPMRAIGPKDEIIDDALVEAEQAKIDAVQKKIDQEKAAAKRAAKTRKMKKK